MTLRNIQLRLNALDELEKRKATVIDTISAQGAMTDEMRARIEALHRVIGFGRHIPTLPAQAQDSRRGCPR